MLEAPSYLVSIDLPSSCQEEIKWIYNAHCFLQLYLKKRLLENDTTKTLRVDEEPKNFTDITLFTKTYQKSNQSQQQGGAAPVTLLDQNALLNCSLSDFKSIASTNREGDKRCNVRNKVGDLPERASSMNGWGLAFRACGDQLVVVGGPRALGGGFIEINACVPRDGEALHWRVLPSKPSGSFVKTCLLGILHVGFNSFLFMIGVKESLCSLHCLCGVIVVQT